MFRRLALLLALLAGFAALVVYYRLPAGSYGNDGSYYVHIARHLAQGDGFVTRVSLHNQGLRELPGPATVYPLWPNLLALVGPVLGFEVAAAVLTPAFALVALALLYVLANTIARRFGSGAEVLATLGKVDLTTGHVAVALVALNRGFYEAALQPITEPLGLSLVFASLLALDRALRGRWQVAWGAVSGALAAAAYLTRFQLAPLALVVPAALLLVAVRERGSRAPFVAALIATVLVVAPWLLHLATTLDHVRPMMLFDFAAYRETPALPAGPTNFGGVGLVTTLARGVESVIDAFVPGGGRARASYLFAFGTLALAVPLAAVLALWQRLATRRWPASGVDGVLPLASLVAGLGMLLPLHVSLSQSFEVRHRLPMILLVIVALSLLNAVLRSTTDTHDDAARATSWPRAGLRALLLVAIVASVASGALFLHRSHERLLHLVPLPSTGEHDAAAWLDQRGAVAAMVLPQRLAVATERTGFHWIGCRSRVDDVVGLLDHVAIDFVVVRASHERCRWTSALPADAAPLVTFAEGGDAIAVYPASVARSYLSEAISGRSDDARERRGRRRAGRRRQQAEAVTPAEPRPPSR